MQMVVNCMGYMMESIWNIWDGGFEYWVVMQISFSKEHMILNKKNALSLQLGIAHFMFHNLL